MRDEWLSCRQVNIDDPSSVKLTLTHEQPRLIGINVDASSCLGNIKELVGRGRPNLEPLAAFSGDSFPSGHSTAALASYLGLAVALVTAWPEGDTVLGGLVLGWAWCLVRVWAMRLTRTTTHPKNPVVECG